MKKYILPVVLIAALTSILTLWGYSEFHHEPVYIQNGRSTPVHYTSQTLPVGTQPVDFTEAAKEAVKCVVHIKTLTKSKTYIKRDPFSFFGTRQYRMPAQMASGSGVIITPDGYIVTNNHVVQGADKVQVTFNNRDRQIAKVVGTDPQTDLAVLKIDAHNLPYMTFGNSDSVKLGQWVLAVGFPLNLDATVTAGIVSAKGRSIRLPHRKNKKAIEAYIQTDAAVNPGNSGGPLVNPAGQLIGINSAIASPTGSFAGYSYAIPSNIVKKVANDIIKYGHSQRGYMGVSIVGLDNLSILQARKLGISKEEFQNAKGVYVADVLPGSGAEKAGLKEGDFITYIGSDKVNTSPQLLEKIALYHPGDKVKVTYIRNDKTHHTEVKLDSGTGESKLAANSNMPPHHYGSSNGHIEKSTTLEAQLKAVHGGVKVLSLGNGILKNETNVKAGFIISKINNQKVKTPADVKRIVKSSPHKLYIVGSYPNENGVYYFGLQND